MSKRDGRREWLRATKLARSVHLALQAAGETDRARSLDLATGIVGSLRVPRASVDEVIDTSQLARLVQATLVARGYTLAALLYAEVGQRRRRAQQPTIEFDAEGRIAEPQPFWSDERLFGRN